MKMHLFSKNETNYHFHSDTHNHTHTHGSSESSTHSHGEEGGVSSKPESGGDELANKKTKADTLKTQFDTARDVTGMLSDLGAAFNTFTQGASTATNLSNNNSPASSDSSSSGSSSSSSEAGTQSASGDSSTSDKYAAIQAAGQAQLDAELDNLVSQLQQGTQEVQSQSSNA